MAGEQWPEAEETALAEVSRANQKGKGLLGGGPQGKVGG